MLFSSNVYGLYVFNQGCKAFTNQCDEGDSVSTQILSLDQLIIQAGGNFLQANSDFQSVLKKIELSESCLIDSLNNTIQNISNANTLYFEIWTISLSLDYDPIVIEKLSQFDYYGYKLENNLNPSIFQKVESFLSKGHIRELFQQAYIDSCKIMEKLKQIKSALKSGKEIDISNYWRLNQLYLEFALFGQYTSEVFLRI